MLGNRFSRRHAATFAVAAGFGLAHSAAAATVTTRLPTPPASTSVVCDVAQAADGQTVVTWLSSPDPSGPSRHALYHEGWIATLAENGQLSGKHRLLRYRRPIPPLKTVGWWPSCPKVIVGSGATLEVVWQRIGVSYYPGNQLIGTSKPSELVHAIRTSAGRWESARAWLKASKAKHPWPDDVRWLDGGDGSGVLLVERRMAGGPEGLKLYGMRRTADGRWGRWMRDDPTDRDMNRRVLAGASGRLALSLPYAKSTTLQLMSANDRQWRPGPPMSALSDECKPGGDVRMAATATTVYAAWSCHFAKGAGGAIATLAVSWDGTVLNRAIVDDRRATEVAGAASSPEIGALVADGSSARLTWMRAAPGSDNQTLPDIYEATLTPGGPAAPTLAVAGANVALPAIPSGTTDRWVDASWLGGNNETVQLTVSDAPPRPAGSDPFAGISDVKRTSILVRRAAGGSWGSITIGPRTVRVTNSGDIDSFVVAGAVIYPAVTASNHAALVEVTTGS